MQATDSVGSNVVASDEIVAKTELILNLYRLEKYEYWILMVMLHEKNCVINFFDYIVI